MKVLAKIWKAIRPYSDSELRDLYLGMATDHSDLERRLRKIDGWG